MMKILPTEYSSVSTTSEYDKVTMPTKVLKDICDDLISRAKKGDKTAFEVLNRVFAAKLPEGRGI